MLIYLVDCRLFIVILIFFNLVFSAFFLTFLYVQKVLCPVNKWVLKQNQSRPTDLECVYDVYSHDACVNPLDNLWCLHLSCHSAKCHMSFSFAFLSQCLFSAFSYPFLSSFFFLFDLSGVCIVLFYFVILTIPSLCVSTFSLCFYFCISYTPPPTHFSVFQCLSCLLGLKDHLYPSGYF